MGGECRASGRQRKTFNDGNGEGGSSRSASSQICDHGLAWRVSRQTGVCHCLTVTIFVGDQVWRYRSETQFYACAIMNGLCIFMCNRSGMPVRSGRELAFRSFSTPERAFRLQHAGADDEKKKNDSQPIT